MFGLSLTELIFTVVLIVAVWRGFKYYERTKASKPRPRAGAARRERMAGDAESGPPATVELVRCPACGTYHARAERCSCKQG